MESDYELARGAIRSGSIEDLERLEQDIESFPHGVDDFLTRPWITNAVHCRSLAAVRWMASRGVNLDVVDDEGSTPLISAIHPHNKAIRDLVRAFIQHGANLDQPDGFGDSPLHHAAGHNESVVCQDLLAAGADPNERNADGKTPLQVAKEANAEHAVKVLKRWS